MRYAVKAKDGMYMRYPDDSVYECESVHGTTLSSAELFDNEEDAGHWIGQWASGKWSKAKVVPIEMVDTTVVTNPEPRFLFIAYKPNSTDTCRGCRVASYSSDFATANMLTAERLVEEWATFLVNNIELSYNEDGYEFYIFKDGVKVWHETHSTWDGTERYECGTEKYYDILDTLSDQEDADRKEIDELYVRAVAVAKQRYQDQLDKKKKEEDAQLSKRMAEEKERLRAQYERLKKEFEPQGDA